MEGGVETLGQGAAGGFRDSDSDSHASAPISNVTGLAATQYQDGSVVRPKKGTTYVSHVTGHAFSATMRSAHIRAPVKTSGTPFPGVVLAPTK